MLHSVAHGGELLAMLRTGDAPSALAVAVPASVPADGKWRTVYDVTHGEYDWINAAFDNPANATFPEIYT